MNATIEAGVPAPAKVVVTYRKQKLVHETGILVSIEGRPAGWIFKNDRTGTYDFTLTDLGETTTDIESAFREDFVWPGGVRRAYKRGLDNVALDVLKERIEELAS